MGITVSDVVFKKSELVTNTVTNGGRKGQLSVFSGGRHNIFPRVTNIERTAGVTRYRKIFWCNENASDEPANSVLAFLEIPSNAEDRFAIGLGTQIDYQSIMGGNDEPDWFSAGQLQTALSGGESAVILTMEGTDFVFPQHGWLHLTNKFAVTQTIDSNVVVGDSVEYTAGTWYRVSSSDEITYPAGIYIGSNTVMTDNSSDEEYVRLAENIYADEVLATGAATPIATLELADLLHDTNGISTQIGFLPVVTAISSAATLTVNVGKDGVCSGDCSAGELNMDTGVWITDITWSGTIDTDEDVLITYYENNFSYTGNNATVDLDTSETVANAYEIANTFGAGCIELDTVEPVISDFLNSGSGTCDDATFLLYNDGTERDNWEIIIGSTITTFTVSGTNEGVLSPTGDMGSDFSPINPNTGQPYFTIPAAAWSGTFVAAESITFKTSPAAKGLWWRQIVPALASAELNNQTIMGWYSE